MEKLITIRTLAQLSELEAYLADKEFVAFDTETTGVEKGSEIIGFSVSAEVGESCVGYYVVLAEWQPTAGKLAYLETREGAKAFISGLLTKNLIMHNAGFDCAIVEDNYGVKLMPAVHTDTMLLAHLLDENRPCGLKELAVAIYGEDSRTEQQEMKASVSKNGGVLTKDKYELYKADSELLARYGAKDAILTLKLFYHLVPELFDQSLDAFFYDEETMPLLRGPTYQLNTTGLRVDPERLQKLKGTLEAECMEAKAFIYREIDGHVKAKYPGTGKKTTFNIGSGKQLAWLLFFQLDNEFNTLTKEGRTLCKALDLRLPYSFSAKREFVELVQERKGQVWQDARVNPKTGKLGRPKKIGDPWNYIAAGKDTLKRLAPKYKWVEKLLELKKNEKLLTTYVLGIQSRMKYNVIRPNFLQHGTTSGRYSCKNPNFQNLPRDDKRVKACIVSRPGKVFVGADYSQLEPRVFASFSKDERLLKCFKSGDDFYSVIGMEVFEKTDCVPLKDGRDDAFGVKYKKLRDIAKVVALSSTYGTTAPKMAPTIGKSMEEAQQVIDSYFEKFPSVQKLMLESHEQAKSDGRVTNLFGRPRRMPRARLIPQLFGDAAHSELDYEWRNILNLAINHRIQSTGASIMNRAAIVFCRKCDENAKTDPRWLEVRLVLQVHDELIAEAPEEIAAAVDAVLKDAMENTVTIPGIDLIAEPKIANDLAALK